MPTYTERQPKNGDQVLLCDHVLNADDKPHCHFFYLPQPLGFVRPDGTGGKASWLVICNDCFDKYPNPSLKDLMLNIIRTDATWQGDEPEIKVNPKLN